MLTLLPTLARHIAVFLSYESCYTCARSYVSHFGEVGYYTYDSLLWHFLFKAETFVTSIFPQIAQTRDPFIPVKVSVFRSNRRRRPSIFPTSDRHTKKKKGFVADNVHEIYKHREIKLADNIIFVRKLKKNNVFHEIVYFCSLK